MLVTVTEDAPMTAAVVLLGTMFSKYDMAAILIERNALM